jgi:outer membrane protein OmpA-like peptidoglycan-associated protein
VIDWDLRCLAAHGASTVEVTGMIWALGSEEYAMALGDRLARGVRDALVARGMSRSDVRTRSVGEERATGHDALGWTRDVRVELR